MFKQITLKLGNARKAEEYTIYPYNGEGSTTIQSDKRIAQINLATGAGIVSNPHSSGAYFHHLVFERNPVQLTAEQIMELKLTIVGGGELLKSDCGAFMAEQKLDNITF